MSPNNPKKSKKLTKHQREVLDLLNQGHVLEIDKLNMPTICGLNISPQTRYFLTDNRYVTRKDKTKSAETKGNGFVITDKGRKALEDNPPPKKRANSSDDNVTLAARIELNAERLSKNKDSAVTWYVISVAKHILKKKWTSPDRSDLPEDKVDTIVKQLSSDERVIKSLENELSLIRDHNKKADFIQFGEYTDKEGFTCTGASKNTIAFNKTKELVTSGFQLNSRINKPQKAKRPLKSDIEKPGQSAFNVKLLVSFIIIVLLILWLLLK